MTHTLSDEEYQQYLKDLDELEYLRSWKIEAFTSAKEYFDSIRFWTHEGRCSKETMYAMISECQYEEDAEYYCDHCPFGQTIGCPFGHEVSYSK